MESITHHIPSLMDEIIRTNYDPKKLINYDKVIHHFKMRKVIRKLNSYFFKRYLDMQTKIKKIYPHLQLKFSKNFPKIFKDVFNEFWCFDCTNHKRWQINNEWAFDEDEDYEIYCNKKLIYHRVLGNKPKIINEDMLYDRAYDKCPWLKNEDAYTYTMHTPLATVL
jgi:hypothetical protein